jgi:mono/diheme cytochrome c family protein
MRRALAGLGVVAAALALAACDSQPQADTANGKQLFVRSCGGCHSLADAGSTGVAQVQGVPVPDLDDAFRASRQHGFNESQFRGVVRQWIGDPAPPMPANIVTGQDAEDVAAYVASVAGRSKDSAVRRSVTLPPPPPPGGPYPGPGTAQSGGTATGAP